MSYAISIDGDSQNSPTQYNNLADISEVSEVFQEDITHQNFSVDDSERNESSQGDPIRQTNPADGSEIGESSQNNPMQQNNAAGGSESVRYYCRLRFWILAVRIFVFLMSEPFAP